MNNTKVPVAPNLFFQYLIILVIPLFIVSIVGPIVAIIWLLWIGCWKLVILGILASIILSVIFPFLLIPSFFINRFLNSFQNNKKTMKFLSIVLSTIYIAIISSFISLYTLKYFVNYSDSNNIIPILLWTFGTIAYPFQKLTKQEDQAGDATASIFNTFFVLLALLITIVYYYFALDYGNSILLFCSIYFPLTILYTISNIPNILVDN